MTNDDETEGNSLDRLRETLAVSTTRARRDVTIRRRRRERNHISTP